MRISKKWFSFVLSVVLLVSGITPVVNSYGDVTVTVASAEAATTTPTLNIGDYIQFGKYNDVPILWRVISKDPTTGNPILFSDRILTIKAYDAKGNYHTGNTSRVGAGSNFYKDSNIRQWLNSSSANSGADLIDWIQNDPIAANMYLSNNPYNTEKGFLADGNFTATERSLIKPLTHKVLLASADQAKKDGGTNNHTYDTEISTVVQNYDTTAYFQNVTDNIFMLSVKQLKEWVFDNSSTLGANYHIAKPTPEAVTQSTYKDTTLNSESDWQYWLNSPRGSSSGNARFVNNVGSVIGDSTNLGNVGVRPALQLNLSSALFASGTGTSGDPYVASAAPTNQAPTDITLSSSSIYENLGSNSSVGLLSATDADAGDTATFDLVSGEGDTDNSSFNISGTDLRSSESFDYETKSSYSVRVRVTDAGGLTFEKSFAITVLDVDDTSDFSVLPVTLKNFDVSNLTANSADISFSADSTVEGEQYLYFVLPLDSPLITSIEAAYGDQLEAAIFLVTNQLQALGISSSGLLSSNNAILNVKAVDFGEDGIVAADLKLGTSYRLFISTLRKADSPIIFTQAVTYDFTTEFTAPTDISLSTSSIVENSASGTTVGTLSATDADAGDTSTFALVNGDGDANNASFVLDGATLKTAASFDYEAKQSYSVRVKVTDSGGLSYEKSLTITVTDETETTPQIGQYVQFGTLYGQPILWRIISKEADGSPILFSDRVLAFKAFDAKGPYHEGARAGGGSNYYPDSNIRQWLNSSSPNSGTDLIDWIQNDPSAANLWEGFNPYHTEKGFLADGNFSVVERSMIKPFTHKVLLADIDAAKADGGSTSHVYREPIADLVQNYDSDVYYKNVTDHVFLLSVKQLKEWVYDNQAILGNKYYEAKPTLTAISNSNFPYSINPDGDRFYWLNTPYSSRPEEVRYYDSSDEAYSIDANRSMTGVRPALQLNVATAIVAAGTGSSADPFILVNNASDISLSKSSVAENAASGTTVGTLSATHVDSSVTFTYTLVSGSGDTDNASFTIDGATLKTAASFDFETKSSYNLRVRVTDSKGGQFEKGLTVSVTDANDAPTDISLTASSIAENAGANATVGTLSGTDVDPGTTLTFSLVAGEGDTDNGLFSVDGTTLKANASFDFETKSSYSVRVQVSDGSLTYAESFAITVTDVNEVPTDISLSATSIAENAGANAGVGAFGGTDPDAGATLTYSLVSGDGDTDNGSFNIDGNSLKVNGPFDFETKSSYSIRVQVSDGSLSYAEAFTITVTDVNEAPTEIALSSSVVNDNSGAGVTVGTLSAMDADTGETFTYSLVSGEGDTDNASFTIDGATLKTSAAVDYETKTSYSVRLQVSDGELAYEKALTIFVTDLQDAPTFTDVPFTAWHSEAVEYLVKLDVLSGDGKGNFTPNRELTRAQFIKMLVTAFQINPSSSEAMNFSDVKNESAWFYPHLLAAKRAGLISGFPDGTFKPLASITRQEMAIFLHRVITYKGYSIQTGGPSLSSFTDADKVSKFAQSIINQMTQASILTGNQNMIRPAQVATRAEGAVVIYRVLYRLAG